MIEKILHISDLHFGRENNEAISAFFTAMQDIKPDTVIVSGDLTQRATSSEYIKAKEFLDKIDIPKIVIPGNHDIPLYNIFRRFINPLKKFNDYIHDEKFPQIIEKDIHIMGINTARSLTLIKGRISHDQISEIKRLLCENQDHVYNILVIHHNFVATENTTYSSLVGRAQILLKEMQDCRIDLILAGHVHQAYTKIIENPYDDSKSTIIVSAGTTISTRARKQRNNFNYLHFYDRNKLEISVYEFDGIQFNKTRSIRYKKTGTEWSVIK